MFPQQPAAHPEHQPATHAEPHPATHPELYQAPQPPTDGGPHPELYQAPQPDTHAPQPEPAQPQPAPTAGGIAGPDAPASGPPVSAPPGYEAPVSGPSAAGFPPSTPASPQPFPPPSPQPSPQPPPPGRTAFRLLVAAAVVLAAAIAVTATLGWSAVSDLRRGVSDREAEQTRVAQQEEAAARKVPEDFRSAGLESKLQRVKDLDKAADVAFRAWRDGGIRLGLLDEAMDACNDAVIAYDVAAGPFPDRLFTSLPKRIDLKNPETDCGRAFTANI
ncbi:hypothetical protein Voc01_074200 [Virgisporangium ochraceum]|uniref:Uncharacterized protein n=2 Tax=Virgisporangium ochraceum TaxID=65505 RepID=A0A8J4A1Q8_9ACTN|nr:hypothetical protein Voc01_074200 [Virgisporangium ochraceum]